MCDSQIVETFKKIQLPDYLEWGWDERFCSALLVIQNNFKDDLDKGVNKAYTDKWDASNFDKAPDNITKLIKHLCGIKPAQMIYSRTLDNGTLFFGAHWPWINSPLISFRVGAYNADWSYKKQLEKGKLIKNYIYNKE